jgi:uncharacterized surface protein with fasciclin (FAS1) repeats
VTPDVPSSNGVVHIIDKVLQPDVLKTILETANTASLSTLDGILNDAKFSAVKTLLQGAGPFTVFAPNNAAFTAAEADGLDLTDVVAVTELLKYHVVAGDISSDGLAETQNVVTVQRGSVTVNKAPQDGSVTVNDAAVVSPNVATSNGFVHVIDKVLIQATIVKNAEDTPSLSTLYSILTNTDYQPVLEILQGSGPFTVFAPNNDAFAAAGLDVTQVTAVTAVLKYHVLSGLAAYSDLLAETQDVATAQGDNVKVLKNATDGAVTVEGVSVVLADVASSNGVVHVVGSLLTIPVDCVDSVANKSTCTSVGQDLHVVSVAAAGPSAAACPNVATLCVAGDIHSGAQHCSAATSLAFVSMAAFAVIL